MVVAERRIELRLREAPAQSQISSRNPCSRLCEPWIDVYGRPGLFVVELYIRFISDFISRSTPERLCEYPH